MLREREKGDETGTHERQWSVKINGAAEWRRKWRSPGHSKLKKVLVSGLHLLPKLGGPHRRSGRGGKDTEPGLGRKPSPSCDDIQAVVQ